jgi:ABC-type polysaccharide/polyol phosphate export permease
VPTTHMQKALWEIGEGLRRWRIWWLLGMGDVRRRYARSKLGEFWITLSMMMFIGAIGSVNAILFNQNPATYIPYLAANFVVWNLISSIINDSSTVFTMSDSFLKYDNQPRTIFVLRSLIRNLISFFHNIIIIPIVILIFSQSFSWAVLLFPVGLVFLVCAAFFMTLLLGVLGTRFRDLPQVIQNIVQVAFFITPVMWPVSALRDQFTELVLFNPFAAFLNIVAQPLRGEIPAAHSYWMALATLVLLASVSLPLFARFRARIVYWL